MDPLSGLPVLRHQTQNKCVPVERAPEGRRSQPCVLTVSSENVAAVLDCGSAAPTHCVVDGESPGARSLPLTTMIPGIGLMVNAQILPSRDRSPG